jgi:hypothetical protein
VEDLCWESVYRKRQRKAEMKGYLHMGPFILDLESFYGLTSNFSCPYNLLLGWSSCSFSIFTAFPTCRQPSSLGSWDSLRFPLSQGSYWVTRNYNFFASIHELMKRVMALRMQGPNKKANRSTKIGPAKGRSHEAQFQTSFHLFQEFANFCLLHATWSYNCWAMSLTIPDWFI